MSSLLHNRAPNSGVILPCRADVTAPWFPTSPAAAAAAAAVAATSL